MADVSFANLHYILFILVIAGLVALVNIGSFDLMNREGVETTTKTRALESGLLSSLTCAKQFQPMSILWGMEAGYGSCAWCCG